MCIKESDEKEGYLELVSFNDFNQSPMTLHFLFLYLILSSLSLSQSDSRDGPNLGNLHHHPRSAQRKGEGERKRWAVL